MHHYYGEDSFFSKEDKYRQAEKKSESSFKLPDFEKFEKDFLLLFQKLMNLFPEFLIKDCDLGAILVNDYLVYQLIWTFKYLVEMAVLENNKVWLKKELPLYKNQFDEIKHNINLADPDSKLQLKACINNVLSAAERGFKETDGEIAIRWMENVVSFGGSVVREVSKTMRIGEAKLTLMKKSLEIASENMAAIINAENYEQWQREKTFYRDGASLIVNESRLQRLATIQKRLKKDPQNVSLLELQSRLLEEQKQYEAKEQIMQGRLGEAKYQIRLKEKQNKLIKIQVKSALDNLIVEYINVSKELNLEDSEINKHLLLQWDSLNKTFSKTLVTDSINIDVEQYTTLTGPVLKAIQNLKILSTMQLKESTSELKPEREIKSIPISDLSSPAEWLLSEKLSRADHTNLITIRTIRKEYSLLNKYITQSKHPAKDFYLQHNQISYEKYISKSAEFFLKQTPERQINYLYEIDEKQEYTTEEIKQKSKELSIIYHPDKFVYITMSQDIFIRIIAIREELITRLKWKKTADQVNVNIETIASGIHALKKWFDRLVPAGMDSVLRGLREFNCFKTPRPSITYQPSSTLTPY